MQKKFFSMALAAAMTVTSVFSTTSVAEAAESAVPYGSVTVEQNDHSVTIGNEAIERTFSIADKKLSTTEIVNKRTGGEGTVFTPQDGSEEFVVKTTKEQYEPIELEAIDRTGWSAEADSYHNASGDSDGPAQNLLDGRTESIWHSNYGGGTGDENYPHSVVITFGKDVTFQSFSYTPRHQGEMTNGNIKGYELYASTAAEKLDYESEEWGEPIAKGEFEYNGVNPIYVNLEESCSAKQIKLVAVSSNNGERYAGGAEFNLHAEKAPIAADDRSFETSDLELKDGNDAVKVEDTEASINGVKKQGKKVTFSFKPYTHKEIEYTIDEVIVMYEGDHFMRKYLEIDVPDEKMTNAEIDYIDLESLKVAESDAQWTIPRGKGGIVSMEEFKANLGQPIYIQGMFFGCEFPAADTEIIDGTGFMRYYSGKTFERLQADNQLTTDGKYVTWQTVAGAARSTENEIIQADFFEYISSIATPSEFRTQYNSWFDNMMKIDDADILESFMEIDRELNKEEVRPLDSYVMDDGWNNYNDTYVVDAERSGTTLNEDGFWTFNSKFPEELTPSSELVQNFGSNFGIWVGPRGGYNFYGNLANIIEKAGNGSKAGGSIDVADRVYVKKFTEMAVNWQKEFGVNYWKWDGFADNAQFNHFNSLGGADGVPVYSETNHHMTGGYHQMYQVTDLWEAWIDLMEAVRKSEKEDGVNNLWISLTCYVNPSPWYLQWANSVWIQCIYDQKDAGFGTTKLNRQITYRDACYYDFVKNHEFQFPLQNLYNHDPVYGKEGTGMNINTASDEDFQNYLYMLSTRGTAFWELYFSDSIMTDGKYEITGEFLEWAEENYHILKNAKMIGGRPDVTTLGDGNTNEAQAEAYGFSCFDGTDGIISLRNPSASADKTITFPFDRTIGVAENAGTLNYHLEHSYLLSDPSAQTGTLTYGEEYTVNLKPNEVRILRVSAEKDTTAPKIDRIMTDGAREITVKFDEKVSGNLFQIENAKAASIKKSADDTTYHIELVEAPEDTAVVKVTPLDIKDLSGNKAEEAASVVYHKDNVIVENEKVAEAGELAAAENSLDSNNGFTVSAVVNTTDTDQTLVKQGGQYALQVTEDGKASFTLNGVTAISKAAVNDGAGHKILGVKENNGMLKLYVDGHLEGSAYDAENRFYKVEKAAVTVGENVSAAAVYDTAYGYDKEEAQNIAKDAEVTAKWTADDTNAAKGGDRPMSMAVDGNKTDYVGNYAEFGADGRDESSYMQIDLGSVCDVDALSLYRYWGDGRTYKDTIVAVAEKEEDFKNGTAVIVYNADETNAHGLNSESQETFDEEYAETSEGRSWTLADNTKVRFVRVYMKGRADSAATTNHIVEMEVFGTRPKKEETPGVDITPLIERLSELTAVDTSNAAADSVAAFKALIKEGYDLVTSGAQTQDEVRAMLEKLKDAEVNVLVDITALKQVILEAGSIELDGYTEASKQALQDALAEAETVLENSAASQTDVDKAAEALRQAIDGLTLKPDETVSKKTLEYFLNSAKEHMAAGDVDSCVESVKKLFEEAVAEGEAVMADENATREEVMNASMKLVKAIHALNMKAADKTDLEMAAELAGMIDLSRYIEAGQQEFSDALAAAEEVLADGDALQGDVDMAWSALVTAMENLRLKANKEALEELLNEAAGLDLSRYTEESVTMFRAAFASAQAVFADEALTEADQQKVDAAAAALKEAKEGLVAKADGSEDGDEDDQNPDDQKSGTSGNKAAKTGDGAPLMGWMMLVILSGAAVLTVYRKRA